MPALHNKLHAEITEARAAAHFRRSSVARVEPEADRHLWEMLRLQNRAHWQPGKQACFPSLSIKLSKWTHCKLYGSTEQVG